MKIVVTDCDHASMDLEAKVLSEAGFPLIHLNCKTEDDLIKECADANIALNQYAPFTRKVISALAPNLKQIVRYGVGVNNVDLEAASEFGVQVCNVPDYGMNEVADHGFAMMMALIRKINIMDKYTKEVKWDYVKAMPIKRIPGSTIGLFGVGRIGRVFAKRLSGFDVRVIAYDMAYKAGEKVDGIEIVDFDTLVKEADAISIHAPLTPETKDIFNMDTFKKMKDGAFIVNTARGGIINEDDLLVALKEGIIAGAALDVTSVEPMPVGSPLFELENFICTPHMAWHSEEAAEELKRKVAEEGVRFAKGEKVHYPVNKI